MRHDDIHWAALRATAKVALSLTVFGCGGTVSISGDKGNGGSSSGSPEGPAATTSQGGASTIQVASAGGQIGQGGTGQPTCSASHPSEPVTLDPNTFACCVDFLDEQSDAAWALPSAELMACCHEVVGQIDLDSSLLASVDEKLVAPTWPPNEAPSCCDVLGNPCTQPCGCTVWGPPMPPALHSDLWSLDMLEVA